MIRYVRPVPASQATGLTKEVYAQIEKEFGSLVEPFTIHSPLPRLLAAAWSAARETEVAGPFVPRKFKEAIAVRVSQVNKCPYCVDAHTIMLDAAGGNDISLSIHAEKFESLEDQRMRKVIHWTTATEFEDTPGLKTPPFTRAEAPEMIGTAVFYQYINRLATVLLGETPLPSARPQLKQPLIKFASLFLFGRAVRREKKSGDSLSFLPEAPLPKDLNWASGSPTVAGAFARLSAVIEDCGRDSLPDHIREFVVAKVQAWRGYPPGLSEFERMLDPINREDRNLAKLALTTALTPHKFNSLLVDEYLRRYPENGQVMLLGALAWSSFTAARRIGSWIQMPAA